MTKLKKLWNKIPTLQELTFKQLMGFAVLMLALLGLAIYGPNYVGAFLSFTARVIILFIFYGFLLHDVIVEERYKKHKIMRKVVIAFLGVVMVLIGLVAGSTYAGYGTQPTKHTDSAPEANTTYIAYSPTCLYCSISSKQMNRAVTMYNETHLNDIVIVDIDEDNTLSKAIKDDIEYKGTIIHYNESGNATMSVYTLANKNSDPVQNKPSSIYEKLQLLNGK